jgi:hypothetical protein
MVRSGRVRKFEVDTFRYEKERKILYFITFSDIDDLYFLHNAHAK